MSEQSQRIWFFLLVQQSYFVQFKQKAGLFHQFNFWVFFFSFFFKTMNDCFCSEKLAPWTLSNLAALTLSCFEMTKHVLYSPAVTAAMTDSRPFNTALCWRIFPMGLFYISTYSSGDKHMLPGYVCFVCLCFPPTTQQTAAFAESGGAGGFHPLKREFFLPTISKSLLTLDHLIWGFFSPVLYWLDQQ